MGNLVQVLQMASNTSVRGVSLMRGKLLNLVRVGVYNDKGLASLYMVVIESSVKSV